ncbi:MAG: hypothetical protein LBU62_11510, partial [Bacteroidales bacterium]|nr:hypothetical protein [Bacteroidales bacterium]
LIGFTEPKWNKISNGRQALDIYELSKIAENLQMREIDIYTYPKRFQETDKPDCEIKTHITFELDESLKNKVLALVLDQNERMKG